MKTLNLNAYGVKELNETAKVKIGGGEVVNALDPGLDSDCHRQGFLIKIAIYLRVSSFVDANSLI